MRIAAFLSDGRYEFERQQERYQQQANFILRLVCYALIGVVLIAASGGWTKGESMSRYNPDEPIGEGVVLPEGEHSFLIVDAEETTSKKGNRMWALKFQTRYNGQTVTRTYYHTFTQDADLNFNNLSRLLDAVGTDPRRPEVEAAIADNRYQAELFVKTPRLYLSAWITHEIYKGTTQDKIRYLISTIGRAAWVARMRKGGIEVSDTPPRNFEKEETAQPETAGAPM